MVIWGCIGFRVSVLRAIRESNICWSKGDIKFQKCPSVSCGLLGRSQDGSGSCPTP